MIYGIIVGGISSIGHRELDADVAVEQSF